MEEEDEESEEGKGKVKEMISVISFFNPGFYSNRNKCDFCHPFKDEFSSNDCTFKLSNIYD